MRPKALARVCAIAGLGAVVAFGAPASSHPTTTRSAERLPACAPAAASVRPPTGPAGLDDPTACRLLTRVTESSGPPRENAPATGGERSAAGYRHLGASTAGEWAGVSGRLTVSDPEVRAGTYDFVAARFMAKRRLDTGTVAWLEVGWAETGWSGGGRQRIYTYDTNGRTWRFYDEFPLSPGDQVWLDVHADADGVWQAWLWWDDRWNLLSAETLPIGATAQLEQYVELHADPKRPARLTVPPVAVAEVHLMAPDGVGTQHDAGARHDGAHPWREDVDTLTGDAAQDRGAGLCLDWTTRYDTWSAGSCPPDTTAPGDSAAPPTPPHPDSPAPGSPADGPAGNAAGSRATDTPGTGSPAIGTPGLSDLIGGRSDPADSTGSGATPQRPRGTQPGGERPVDEEPATVIGDRAPTEATGGKPLLSLLGNQARA
jgi:hypothetical protein